MAGMWLVGEDMPQETNRVTLDPKAKDKFGMPVASVHYDDHPNDVAMRDHAYKQGSAVYEAVGATVTYPTTPYPSTHNMGTNRMSAKARDGVVNKFGQTHDIKNLFVSDGSQFTSGAACNPTLTIVALAIRQADHIAGAMQRKEIWRAQRRKRLRPEAAWSRFRADRLAAGRNRQDYSAATSHSARPRQKFGDSRGTFRSIDQAGAAQQRSEIMHLAAMIEHLAVKRRQEFRETHVFLARDFFQRIPERHLQPDRRAMAIDAQRSGLQFIVPLRLVSEQLAHGYPPDLL